MLSMGAQVSTQNTQQANSTQSNNLTINVGDGGQTNKAETEQSATQQAKQEYTKKDDFAASVGVGVGGGSGSGGPVTTKKQNEPIDDGFFNLNNADFKKYLPYIVVGGIALAFMFFIYTIVKPSKKKKR